LIASYHSAGSITAGLEKQTQGVAYSMRVGGKKGEEERM
jgi:hypothetical protein